jgi:hypothetical protein
MDDHSEPSSPIGTIYTDDDDPWNDIYANAEQHDIGSSSASLEVLEPFDSPLRYNTSPIHERSPEYVLRNSPIGSHFSYHASPIPTEYSEFDFGNYSPVHFDSPPRSSSSSSIVGSPGWFNPTPSDEYQTSGSTTESSSWGVSTQDPTDSFGSSNTSSDSSGYQDHDPETDESNLYHGHKSPPLYEQKTPSKKFSIPNMNECISHEKILLDTPPCNSCRKFPSSPGANEMRFLIPTGTNILNVPYNCPCLLAEDITLSYKVDVFENEKVFPLQRYIRIISTEYIKDFVRIWTDTIRVSVNLNHDRIEKLKGLIYRFLSPACACPACISKEKPAFSFFVDDYVIPYNCVTLAKRNAPYKKKLFKEPNGIPYHFFMRMADPEEILDFISLWHTYMPTISPVQYCMLGTPNPTTQRWGLENFNWTDAMPEIGILSVNHSYV